MPARNFNWFPVVVNVAHFRMRDNGPPEAIPYALTLIPASKRGSVDERGIDVIAKLNIEKTRAETEPCYAGLDPFSGEWRLFGPLAILILRFCNSDSVPKPRDHFRDVQYNRERRRETQPRKRGVRSELTSIVCLWIGRLH